MSNVPPSPARARRFIFFLFFSLMRALSIPEATLAAVSKAPWIHGTLHDVSGYGVENTSRHPVALETIVFLPAAFITNLTASDCPHPAHALCPGANSSSVDMLFIILKQPLLLCLLAVDCEIEGSLYVLRRYVAASKACYESRDSNFLVVQCRFHV